MIGISIMLSSIITNMLFTWFNYEPYYTSSHKLLYVLCAVSGFLSILYTLGTAFKKPKLSYAIFLFAPFLTLYSITYNAIFSLFTFVVVFIVSLFLPKKRRYIKITFDADSSLVYTTKKCKIPFCKRLNRTFLILSAAFSILFVLTCINTTPSKIWQVKLFPNDYSAKTIFAEDVYPSGKVTQTAWYDENAITVADFFDIETENGTVTSPCKIAGIQKGDIITAINSQSAYTSDFIKNQSGPFPVSCTVLRIHSDGKRETLTFDVMPVFGKEEQKYLLGISFYPSAMVSSSIQTVSFIYPSNGYFAATAHSSEEVYSQGEVKYGILLDAIPSGRDKDGLNIKSLNDIIGTVLHTNDYGSFGIMASNGQNPVPVSKKSDIRYGNATLLSNFEGSVVREYSVFVTGTYRINDRDVICFVVTDNRLKNAGGITKGMSGSPIIQNGKIIGALSNMDTGGMSAYATYAYDMAHELFLASESFDIDE